MCVYYIIYYYYTCHNCDNYNKFFKYVFLFLQVASERAHLFPGVACMCEFWQVVCMSVLSVLWSDVLCIPGPGEAGG